MEFNLADLFECVVDHVPDREALVCGARRCTYRELDAAANRVAARSRRPRGRARRPRRPRPARRRRARRADPRLLQAAGRPGERELPLRRRRARVPRARRATSRRWSPRAAGRRPQASTSRPASRSTTPGHHSPKARTRTKRCAPRDRRRVDFAPRSGDDHYVLYTGGTTGLPKGVVWRHEDIFFAALGGGNPGGPPIEQPEAIGPGVVANPAGRVAAFLGPDDPGPTARRARARTAHARERSVVDARHAAQRRDGRPLRPSRTSTSPRSWISSPASGSWRSTSSATRSRGRSSSSSNRGPVRGTRRRCCCSVRAGASSPATSRTGCSRALPSVVALIDGIGSSESPAQAVAVTTRARDADRVAAVRREGRRRSWSTTSCARSRPAPGSSGGSRPRAGCRSGYLGDPERSAAHVRRDRRPALVAAG